MKLLTIHQWAGAKFDRPPCEKTLQRWAREGLIWPPARKLGKAWMVPPNARKVDRDDPVLRSVYL